MECQVSINEQILITKEITKETPVVLVIKWQWTCPSCRTNNLEHYANVANLNVQCDKCKALFKVKEAD